MAKAQAPGRHAGHLTLWGVPELDAIVTIAKQNAAPKEIGLGIGHCVSCRRYRQLFKGHCAVLCQDCHDEITELAKPGRLWE